MQDNPLSLEKLKIAERLENLEKAVLTASEQSRQVHLRIFGDLTQNPPIDGHETRLRRLERLENERAKSKEGMVKTALGSVTIAVGAVVLWIFTTLKDALFHK